MRALTHDATPRLRAGLLGLLLAVPSAPALAAAASDGALPLTEAQARAAGITTTALAAAPGAGRITLTGRVEVAENGPDPVLAPAQARVIAVFAHPGDRVERGAPLLALAGPEVAAMRRALDDASTLARTARQRALRDRQLYDEGIVAKARLEQAQSAALVADGQLTSQRQILGAATFDTSGRLVLRAPRAGLVGGPSWGTGDALSTGDLVAYVGAEQAPLVSLDAPVMVARSLQAGDQLMIHARGCEESAVLHAIGRNVDPATQTVALHAELTGPSCLLPGEIITAFVTPHALLNGAFALPPGAFVRRGPETYVFLRSAHGFLPVSVDTTAARAGFARAPALRAGMLVAVQGTALLKAELLKRGDT